MCTKWKQHFEENKNPIIEQAKLHKKNKDLETDITKLQTLLTDKGKCTRKRGYESECKMVVGEK